MRALAASSVCQLILRFHTTTFPFLSWSTECKRGWKEEVVVEESEGCSMKQSEWENEWGGEREKDFVEDTGFCFKLRGPDILVLFKYQTRVRDAVGCTGSAALWSFSLSILTNKWKSSTHQLCRTTLTHHCHKFQYWRSVHMNCFFTYSLNNLSHNIANSSLI